MKYIVFLDFDGVLTSQRQHLAWSNNAYPMWSKFDPVAIEFLNRLCEKYDDVSIVWTTTWRNAMDDQLMTEHWIYTMFHNAGFRGKFGTPWRVNPENDKNLYGKRAKEIDLYLEKYKPDDFIIFDDMDYNFDAVLGKKRFVQTHHDDGMLTRHMKNALSLAGNWDRKR